ncbi:HNH endonuclease signature motif containing protein [Marilutibacter aestuarii]|nr:HNH endonuclease signature motif containing protein [Lysobacter aestuarii]
MPRPLIFGVVRHEATGFLVDPQDGVIYGVRGTPIGSLCADGYVRIGWLSRGCQYAHRVVYEAVHGAIPQGLEIDHLNGIKADNRISNLEAVTRSENAKRALANGLAPVGEQRSQSKLTDALVSEIRATAGFKSEAEWARELGMDRSTIRAARDGTTWRHVPLRGRSRPSQPTSTRRNSRPSQKADRRPPPKGKG